MGNSREQLRKDVKHGGVVRSFEVLVLCMEAETAREKWKRKPREDREEDFKRRRGEVGAEGAG